MVSGILDESRYVKMQEDELRRVVGLLHERLKAIEEQRKEDPELQRLKDEAKAYDEAHYADEIKIYKKQLAAARHVAKLKGVRFELENN